ncbi:hypothetical protein JB92DRAFT_420220 [Gautieria morchelliformis]|nr:hypothetical protein JB92DRAFT_420220 [Gautieria morchelliformis]
MTSPSTSNPDTERASIAYVFVCRADIDPPLLVAHVPELVASCNAPAPSCKSPPVHLITLPKLAEVALAEAVGLRRVSIVALDSATPSLATVSSLLADIQPPSAAWLTGPAPQHAASHIPTHIKQLRTTAPRDMRAAKQARIEGRRAAKERNKLKAQSKTNNRNKETNKETRVKAVRKVKVKAKPSKNRVKVVSESSTAGAQDFLPA